MFKTKSQKNKAIETMVYVSALFLFSVVGMIIGKLFFDSLNLLQLEVGIVLLVIFIIFLIVLRIYAPAYARSHTSVHRAVTLEKKQPSTDLLPDIATLASEVPNPPSFPVLFFFHSENSIRFIVYRMLTQLEFTQMSILRKKGAMGVSQISSSIQSAIGFISIEDLNFLLTDSQSLLRNKDRIEIHIYPNNVYQDKNPVPAFVDDNGWIHVSMTVVLSKAKMYQFLQKKGVLQA